ncbi:MAG TPA: flagellar protein FlgN [Microthrixaceae bacterium]|nr:flagellar protein FlgN [Microthrixaceae bacterium]
MATVDDRSSGDGPIEPELDQALGELSHVLWRLRDLTSILVYRLEVQQLVLLAGRVRWVDLATEDVDRCLEAIRREERTRAEVVEQLAPMLGTAPDASLRQLCEAAPSPWDVVLAEHQSEFLTLSAEAEDAARGNRELLHQGLAEVREFIDTMKGRAVEAAGEEGYGALGGASSPAPASAVLVDRDV